MLNTDPPLFDFVLPFVFRRNPCHSLFTGHDAVATR
jgi:hypothetical protein